MEMQYTETAILLAIMEGRNDDARALIAEMLPYERRALYKQVTFMGELLDVAGLYSGRKT